MEKEDELRIEEKQKDNGKRKWCDRCGNEMSFKRLWNIGWYCSVCFSNDD